MKKKKEKLLKKKSTQIYKESISLNKIIYELGTTLSQILKKDVSFIQKNFDDRITVYANYNDLFRVLLNLCTNANDAIESKGTIEIDYCLISKDKLQSLIKDNLQYETYCKLTVTDSGKGIPKENLVKIFDEGFSTKNKNVESGFGLNIVQEIIISLDGYIFVESEIDKGTSFEFYLPSFIDDMIKEERSRIIIADDEEPVRESLSELLEGYNYEITQASNGSEVLDLFEESNEIDLLIIDKNMPVTDGIECIKKINDRNYLTKIILVSGNELEDEEAFEIKEMVDKVIVKPYNFFDLLNDIFRLTKSS